jgi:hypothetical protein
MKEENVLKHFLYEVLVTHYQNITFVGLKI